MCCDLINFAAPCVFLGFSKLHAFGGLLLLIFIFSTLLGFSCTTKFFSTNSLVKNAAKIVMICSLDTLLPDSNIFSSIWWSTHASTSSILFRFKPLHTSAEVPFDYLHAKFLYCKVKVSLGGTIRHHLKEWKKNQKHPNHFPRPFTLNVFTTIIFFFSCLSIACTNIWLEVYFGIFLIVKNVYS